MSTVTAATGAATPALSSALQAPGGKIGKDEFLKMLVTQLRHQDPMNPMQGQEVAAQLAQFSSVEQLVELNRQMGEQAGGSADLLQSLNNNVALSTIGRSVLAVGDQVGIPAGGDASSTRVTFSVGDNGGRATLKLLGADGSVIGTRALGMVGPGKQSVELGSAAAGLPPGSYRYAVEIADATGAAVPVQTFTSGTVDGVRYGESGAVLTAGPRTIGIDQGVQVGR